MLDFLGIGAQKAGTTWLFQALAAHPALRFPAAKEVHFWDLKQKRGIEWYRGLFNGAPPGVRCGEITPAYSTLPAQDVRAIRGLNGALRIFYVLRNPIERAWSGALMALAKSEMTADEASDQWFLDHFRSRGSLARGDYEACLRTWRAVFAPEQLLVLRYEHLCADPLGFVQACCAHIGADPQFYARTPPAVLGQRVLAGTGEPIRASLLPALHAIYRPKIAALGLYLGADLSAWLERA